MITDYLLPFIISFALAALCGKLLLPLLIRLKAGQTEREDGPASHKTKGGTPTMGGFIFLIPLIAVSAFYIPGHRNIVPVIIATVLFALIGFIDDYLKVVKKHNLGLRAWQKFLLQILASLAVLLYIMYYTNISFEMRVPFSALFSAGGTATMISLGMLAIPVEIFAMCGTANGSNFTDGLDGLAASVTAVITVFITVASTVTVTGIEPASMAFLGSLLGFLIYNRHPAKVFMGDTGSLALGGFVCTAFIMMNMTIYIPIVAFIYILEVISVILQVSYFNATNGKRLFKMAPIHHHFELSGWSESRVVIVFAVTTLVFVIVGLAAI